jgi:hypothetical protein
VVAEACEDVDEVGVEEEAAAVVGEEEEVVVVVGEVLEGTKRSHVKPTYRYNGFPRSTPSPPLEIVQRKLYGALLSNVQPLQSLQEIYPLHWKR